MREPPADLPHTALCTRVREAFGIAIAKVELLPVGGDISAWSYRLRANTGTSYFLKVRRGVPGAASLLVPRYLHDRGMAPIVAPLPARDGRLWAEVGGYALVLHPFVAERTGMERGMAPRQWRALGAVMRGIHDSPLVPELVPVLNRETFAPDGAATVRDLQERLAHPSAEPVAGWWRERLQEIRGVLAWAEELGRQLSRRRPPLVLCHADIHTNNVLLDHEGALWIVDWDDAMLAPRERDLMFCMGGGLSRAHLRPEEEAWFLEGYGPATVDRIALRYYRCARAISDIAYVGAQVALRPDLSAGSRQAARERLERLFLPGNIVDLALSPPPAR